MPVAQSLLFSMIEVVAHTAAEFLDLLQREPRFAGYVRHLGVMQSLFSKYDFLKPNLFEFSITRIIPILPNLSSLVLAQIDFSRLTHETRSTLAYRFRYLTSLTFTEAHFGTLYEWTYDMLCDIMSHPCLRHFSVIDCSWSSWIRQDSVSPPAALVPPVAERRIQLESLTVRAAHRFHDDFLKAVSSVLMSSTVSTVTKIDLKLGPWAIDPAAEALSYLGASVQHLCLDIRLNTEILEHMVTIHAQALQGNPL